LAELFQFLLREDWRAAIHARADQDSVREFRFAFQLLQPELRALERVLPIAGVKQNH
jgi:hypothetical protein